jgi:hypothetical protein
MRDAVEIRLSGREERELTQNIASKERKELSKVSHDHTKNS